MHGNPGGGVPPPGGPVFGHFPGFWPSRGGVHFLEWIPEYRNPCDGTRILEDPRMSSIISNIEFYVNHYEPLDNKYAYI